MKDWLLRDPSMCLGIVVWLVAAMVFPFQLGLGHASAMAFVAYLAIAGILLAGADAALNPKLFAHWSDVAMESAFWTIGLAVPALLAFAIGSSLAPAADTWEDELCDITEISLPADHSESALAEAIDPLEECEAGK